MILYQPTKCSIHNPFHIEIRNIKEHPWHMHSQNTLEIIYVLKGTLSVGISIYPSVMKQGDIAVVNSETLHSYKSDADNTVLVCHIDLSYFSSIISDIENTLIICNSAAADEYDKHYGLLRKALADVFVYYFDISAPAHDELMDSCVSFLSVLYNHFNFLRHEGIAIKAENTMKQRPAQAGRIKRVIRYIYDNLGNKISLEEIAASEYVSKYYLSHLLSEFLSMSFRDYLIMTRAVYAQDYLYGTDMSLAEIADQCGFSSADAFRKAYRKYAGATPADDRKRIAGHTAADIPFLDEDFLATGSIWEAAAMMHIKTSRKPAVNALPANSCPVTNVPIDLAHPSGESLVRTWDTVTIGDPLRLLSHKTLEALSILREYGCFSKLHVKARTLASLHESLGGWSFMGTFLKTLEREGFTLLIEEDSRETEDICTDAPAEGNTPQEKTQGETAEKDGKNDAGSRESTKSTENGTGRDKKTINSMKNIANTEGTGNGASIKNMECKNSIFRVPDCLAELIRFSQEIGGAKIQFMQDAPANRKISTASNASATTAGANTPENQKTPIAPSASASPADAKVPEPSGNLENSNAAINLKNPPRSSTPKLPEKSINLDAPANAKAQANPADAGRHEPAALIASALNGMPQYPSLFKDKKGRPCLLDANNLKTKAFYAYYFLNKLQPHSLYCDDGCCVTHAKGKTVILLYNDGRTAKEKHTENDTDTANFPHAQNSDCTKNDAGEESSKSNESESRNEKTNDASIKKYMFNLKHISKTLTHQCLTLDENYESEAKVFASLTMDAPAPDLLSLDDAHHHEILRRIQIKAYPDTKIASISASPEYNLFLSSPPHTVTLIELE